MKIHYVELLVMQEKINKVEKLYLFFLTIIIFILNVVKTN